MKKSFKPLRDMLRRAYPDFSSDAILSLVLSGCVRVDGETVRDPRQLVNSGATLEIEEGRTTVSRGIEKLLPILRAWRIEAEGKVFLDVGCANGGFTQALLTHGARLVHAVDVGYNLLDYRLRQDERVRVHERTNIMTSEPTLFSPPAQSAVVDLSFRSLVGACSHILELVSEGGMICLVKPQFEWRHPSPDFEGVIRDEKILREVLTDVVERLRREACFVHRMAPSPLRGRKGNREFFFLVDRRPGASRGKTSAWIDRVVSEGTA